MKIKEANKVIAEFMGHDSEVKNHHQWYLREDGSPDCFTYENHYCNGYVCKRCGFSYCHHCKGCTDPESEFSQVDDGSEVDQCKIDMPSYLSLDALVPVWRVLRDKLHSMEINLNERIGSVLWLISDESSEVLQECVAYCEQRNTKSTQTIQEAAAIATAKAIKEIK